MGLGLRGNTSRTRTEEGSTTHRPGDAGRYRLSHFKIDLDAFGGPKFRGVSKINLKYFRNDGTRTKELFSYDLFRRYGVWTAPRVGYADLYLEILEADQSVTRVKLGAYMMLESLDENYLKARRGSGRFADDKGFLFKCLYPADLLPQSDYSWMIGVEDVRLNNAESVTYTYDLKTRKADIETARGALAGFIDQLSSISEADFPAWIAGKMDVQLFLKTLAANVALGMWDDHWWNKNNFYLNLDSDGRVYMVPYDYDNTLGTSWQGLDIGRYSPINWGITAERPLVGRILNQPAYLAAYKTYLQDLVANSNLMEPVAAIARVNAWHTMLETGNYHLQDSRVAVDGSGGLNPPFSYDGPADWGSQENYRILTGTASSSPANYFFVRRDTIDNHINDSYIAWEYMPPDAPRFLYNGPFFSVTGPDRCAAGFEMSQNAALVLWMVQMAGDPSPTVAQMHAGLNGNGTIAPPGSFSEEPIEKSNPYWDEYGMWKDIPLADTDLDIYIALGKADGSYWPNLPKRTSGYTTINYRPQYLQDTGGDPAPDQITFTFPKPDDNIAVYVKGDFNGFTQSEAWRLSRTGRGLWQITVPTSSVPSGSRYYFSIPAWNWEPEDWYCGTNAEDTGLGRWVTTVTY